MSNLDELRERIDGIDGQLVKLLNERARVVVEVGHLKRSQKDAPPIYAPDREQAILQKICRQNEGPLPDRTLVAIWREMMSGSFFLERPLRIAYLGPEGSYSHTAAMLKFGQSVEYEGQTDIHGVFSEVCLEHCDMGVVPIENSIAGGVIETLDALIEMPVHICAEVLVSIRHNVLAKCSLEEIETVYSKPEVFSQCRKWLSSTLPEVRQIPALSTAEAAHRVMTEPRSAAIGSHAAAELYGLQMVCENIQDTNNNVTRFLVISRESARPSGDDKTSLVFSTAHKAGALVDVLQAFRGNEVNLTNIESRPSKKREREYYFFVDCQGHQQEAKIQKALKQAGEHCLQLSVLGSFPRAQGVL